MHEISITFTNGTKVDKIVPNANVDTNANCLVTYEELSNKDEKMSIYPLKNILEITIVSQKEKEKTGE